MCDLNMRVLDLRTSKAKAVTFLVVQWLELCAFTVSTAGGMGLIPSWGTKIQHAFGLITVESIPPTSELC